MTKPIIHEGDYLITYHNESDNEISQSVAKSLHSARSKAKQERKLNPDIHSHRILRCLDNSKYNKWTPAYAKSLLSSRLTRFR